jgi:hypothetical protein
MTRKDENRTPRRPKVIPRTTRESKTTRQTRHNANMKKEERRKSRLTTETVEGAYHDVRGRMSVMEKREGKKDRLLTYVLDA